MGIRRIAAESYNMAESRNLLLAQNHTVILPDLRGYGDSDKPTSDPAHRTYSKRTMAQDIVMLMDALSAFPFCLRRA